MAKLNSEKRKKSSFNEEKIIVGLTSILNFPCYLFYYLSYYFAI